MTSLRQAQEIASGGAGGVHRLVAEPAVINVRYGISHKFGI